MEQESGGPTSFDQSRIAGHITVHTRWKITIPPRGDHKPPQAWELGDRKRGVDRPCFGSYPLPRLR
jgi:hypothetical protein